MSGVWVHDLADAADDPRCGGKARGLARLVGMRLPVPAGFVIDGGAFRSLAGELPAEVGEVAHALEAAAERIARGPLPEDFVAEVERRVRALAGPLAVRSSATIEDGAAGAAAGVFSSRTAVAPEHVWSAIRAVWASALTPLAAAYARRRGGEIAIGVIVQRYVAGAPVVVYTRPPGAPDRDELLVQRGDRVERMPRDAGEGELRRLALAAEVALGATRGADVELVEGEGPLAIVQARAIVHPERPALVPPPPILLAPLGDGQTWTWDVAHNPDPLSPAQQGLVERVEQAGVAPYALRVCAGYLYSAPRAKPPAPPIERAAELEARLERTLDEARPPATVEEAIDRYLRFYSIWANELAPLIAALPRAAGSRPSSVEAVLAAAARGELAEADAIARLGSLAPAWDVAAPSYGERPELITAAIARARAAVAAPDVAAPRLAADPASDLAERDDALFARAQLLVRRALLARGRELHLHDPDDIFWLPLGESPADPDEAHRRAGAARTAATRAARWQMPLVVGPDVPTIGARTALHGTGTGPRVTGRVVRFATLASAISANPGDVVVTRAVTPALAVLVVGCAAIVSETGGLLDHGAALARELGIPCVVGCHAAWSELADGMVVTVDGDAGIVSRP